MCLGVLQSPLANTPRKRGIFPSERPQHLPLHSSAALDAIPHILQDSWSSCILPPGTGQQPGDLWLKDSPRHAQGLGTNKMQGPAHRQVWGVLQLSIPLSSVWERMHPVHPSPALGTTSGLVPGRDAPLRVIDSFPPGVGKDSISCQNRHGKGFPGAAGAGREGPQGSAQLGRDGGRAARGWAGVEAEPPGAVELCWPRAELSAGMGRAVPSGRAVLSGRAVPSGCPHSPCPFQACPAPSGDRQPLVQNPPQLRAPRPHCPVLHGEHTLF